MNKILVEVSVGELLDKISILEIKQEKIKDLEKFRRRLQELEKENGKAADGGSNYQKARDNFERALEEVAAESESSELGTLADGPRLHVRRRTPQQHLQPSTLGSHSRFLKGDVFSQQQSSLKVSSKVPVGENCPSSGSTRRAAMASLVASRPVATWDEVSFRASGKHSSSV